MKIFIGLLLLFAIVHAQEQQNYPEEDEPMLVEEAELSAEPAQLEREGRNGRTRRSYNYFPRRRYNLAPRTLSPYTNICNFKWMESRKHLGLGAYRCVVEKDGKIVHDRAPRYPITKGSTIPCTHCDCALHWSDAKNKNICVVTSDYGEPLYEVPYPHEEFVMEEDTEEDCMNCMYEDIDVATGEEMTVQLEQGEQSEREGQIFHPFPIVGFLYENAKKSQNSENAEHKNDS